MVAKALLFDLDGTLWDSYPCYGAAFQFESVFERETVIERLRAGDNVIQLAREYDISKTRLLRHCRAAIEDLALYPGVSETLNDISLGGVPLGIVTNLPRWL